MKAGQVLRWTSWRFLQRMRRPGVYALLSVVTLPTGCDEPYSFHLEVVQPSAAADADVRFDGRVVPGGILERVFDSYQEATSQPDLVVEVVAGGVVLDTQPVAFDACRITCEQLDGDGCGLSDLVESQLVMSVLDGGELSELQGSCSDGVTTFVFTP